MFKVKHAYMFKLSKLLKPLDNLAAILLNSEVFFTLLSQFWDQLMICYPHKNMLQLEFKKLLLQFVLVLALFRVY